MAPYPILAERSVSISALRNRPAEYFTDEPVAVLSHNKPTGYVIGAQAYERIRAIVAQYEQECSVQARFRPTAYSGSP